MGPIMPSLGRDTDEYLRIYRNRIRKTLQEFYKDTYYESVYDFTGNVGAVRAVFQTRTGYL